MGYFGNPFVPVLVHEVVDHASCGQGQVGVEVAGAAGVFHFSYYYYSGFVGRQQEAVDASGVLGGLGAGRSVGVHCPHLHGSVGCGIEECYPPAAVEPHGTAFALGCVGDAQGFAAVDGYCVEVVVGAVCREVFVGDSEEHCLAVGRNRRSRYSAEAFYNVDGVGGQVCLSCRCGLCLDGQCCCAHCCGDDCFMHGDAVDGFLLYVLQK